MKLAKTLALGVLALAFADIASATTLKITGSSAYRKAIYATLIGNGYNQAAYVGSSIDGANQAVFTNGTDYIQTCFAGSVGGVKWLTTNEKAGTSPTASKAISWLDPLDVTYAAASVAAAPDYLISGGAQVASSQGGVALTRWEDNGVGAGALADISMSDSKQTSTAYKTPALTPIINGGVGVVPFVFAKGKVHPSLPAGSYNRFLNVSALAFQNLAAGGSASLATFTGNTADMPVEVVLTGRDNDSGTRLATNFETGYGDVDTFMFQYQPFAGATDGGAAGTTAIDNFVAFDLGTGQAGYASGGSVKTALGRPVSGDGPNGGTDGYIILGYLGEGDSPTQLNPATSAGGGQELAYNGVNYSVAAAQKANYTFWTIEFMYKRSDMTDSGKNILAAAIGNSLKSTYATAYKSGIKLDANFQASRASEGQVVNPTY